MPHKLKPKLNMIRGLIFDLDGTLVESSPGITAALNHALEDCGLPSHPESVVRGFIGDGVEALVARALPETERHRVDEVVARFQKHYPEDWKTGTIVFPGMLEALEKFRDADLRLAVLSNKPDHYTRQIVEALFPDELFETVRGAQEGIPRKPDPTSTLLVVKNWEMNPEVVAYVGDSTIDLATAKAGGLVPLIFDWGYGTPEGIPLLGSAEELVEAVMG